MSKIAQLERQSEIIIYVLNFTFGYWGMLQPDPPRRTTNFATIKKPNTYVEVTRFGARDPGLAGTHPCERCDLIRHDGLPISQS